MEGGTRFHFVTDGDGARLFEDLGDAEVQLAQVRAVEAPGVTHIKYRSVNEAGRRALPGA